MATIVGSLAENTDTNNVPGENPDNKDLVSWVMVRVNEWRNDRDATYEKVWGEYWRLWRGRHTAADKTRDSERSKLVSPALSQALEMTVAELEEASFGRDNWIDILDDKGDPDHADVDGIRQQFQDDLKDDKVPSAIADCYLNGGLYGTLAAKVVVEEDTFPVFEQEAQDPDSALPPKMGVRFEPRTRVRLVPIPVTELIGDPNGTEVEDMLGIAHEVSKPRAWILTQDFGADYASRNDGDPGTSEEMLTAGDKEHPSILATNTKQVLVTEYHGLVPKALLNEANKESDEPEEEEDPLAAAIVGAPKTEGKELDGDGEMVEAIVTIFDKTHLALAIENPFLMKDRSIVVCQFDRVPGRFHGRGVMEKGYNPQKALDAEIRTRMDVMALIANPMMGADSTALPRGFDMRVRPGKVWMTTGNPKEALFPVQFPNLDPASFSQTSEMERMVQMGTGAMDTATPLAENRRNETLGGTSLIAGTFVKRAKRSLRNITENFVQPLVQKILWRRMEWDAARYPKDFNFRIVGTLGIVAREVEQQQMTQMLSLVEAGSKTQSTLIKAIFDSSNSPFKAELQAALEEDAQPDPAQQAIQQLQQQAAEIEVETAKADLSKTMSSTKEIEAKIIKTLAEVEVLLLTPGINVAELRLKRETLEKELEEVRQFARQNDISAFTAINNARGNSTDGNRQKPSDGGSA
jgi:hypothetical protein